MHPIGNGALQIGKQGVRLQRPRRAGEEEGIDARRDAGDGRRIREGGAWEIEKHRQPPCTAKRKNNDSYKLYSTGTSQSSLHVS